MHDYSIDSPIRQKANVVLAIVSFLVPGWFAAAAASMGMIKLGGMALSFGAVFALLEWLFDRWIWRALAPAFGIPNLNGTWEGHGVSSWTNPETNQPHHYTMEITIRQTFTKLEVHTETVESTSRSFMASFETQHAVTQFHYGFENEPRNMADPDLHRHSGMMNLRIEANGKRMSGDYFSGKHRVRHGEIHFVKKSKS